MYSYSDRQYVPCSIETLCLAGNIILFALTRITEAKDYWIWDISNERSQLFKKNFFCPISSLKGSVLSICRRKKERSKALQMDIKRTIPAATWRFFCGIVLRLASSDKENETTFRKTTKLLHFKSIATNFRNIVELGRGQKRSSSVPRISSFASAKFQILLVTHPCSIKHEWLESTAGQVPNIFLVELS